MEGIVDADDTCFAQNSKGDSSIREWRKPRTRGHSQVAVQNLRSESPSCRCMHGKVRYAMPSLTGCNGNVWMRRLNPTNTVMVTDGASSYAKFAQIRSLHHEVVLAKRRVRDAFHVQHVNQHHSALKDLINHHFHGVSSYRLPSYLRLYERTRGTKPWDTDAFFERLAFSTRSLYTKSTQK